MGDSDMPSEESQLVRKWFGGRFSPVPPQGDCWMCWEEAPVGTQYILNHTCNKCEARYFRPPFDTPVDHHVRNLLLWRDSGYWEAMPFEEFIEKLGARNTDD